MTRLRTLSLLVLLAIGSVGSSGCSVKLPQRAVNSVPRNFYRIELPEASRAAQTSSGVLMVRPISVSTPFSESNFVRRDAKGTYLADPYNQFLSEPGAVLSDAVELHIRNAGVFSTVVSDYSVLQSDYVLESTVEELYGVETSAGPRAVLSIRFLLVDRRAATLQRVLVDQSHRQEIEIPSLAAAELKAGWERGLANALDKLNGAMAQATAP